MTGYADLGLRPIINADATLTRLGGSLMPPEVLQAMHEAAQCFVDLHALQIAVGERLADITRNEAAYVATGAAAGLVLATAACITGEDHDLVTRFPDLTGLKNEVIVHHTHRNGYDYAVRQIGVNMIEIGADAGTDPVDLERALTEQTAAVFWFQGGMTTPGDIPLAQVAEIAHGRGVPVIVDAAAQLPPLSNLWDFTHKHGADMAIFSGGKDLRGPQASGLMVGRKDLIAACRMHGSPNHAVGRPMKVGKEEMLGLLAAVERYLALDHAARELYCEDTVVEWCRALNLIDGVTAKRSFPNEAAQPLPRCLVTLDPAVIPHSRDTIVQRLLDGNPAVAAAKQGMHGIYLNPMTLEPDEEHIVQARLIAELTRS
jgi:uncharacterized pyridoxal phosphate-dependent enzyme